MLERIVLYILDATLFIWLFGPLRIAAAASVAVIVSVTVLKPVTPDQEISVLPLNLDMTGQTSGELTITNHSAEFREIRIDLMPQPDNTRGCRLLYSPSFSTLSPHSTQVVRVVIQNQNTPSCRINHRFIISNSKAPSSKIIEVLLSSTPDDARQ